MKNLCAPELQCFRIKHPVVKMSDAQRAWDGAFQIPFKQPGKYQPVMLRCIVSRGDPSAAAEEERWDHLSVSLPNRCPTWDELEFVKRLFFERDECAMQLHVPPSDHINNHPYCLHIWRPTHLEIPRPPSIMVGHQQIGTLAV